MPRSSQARSATPDRTALTFFLSAERLDETHVWTYAELIADVTRAANLFASLGIAADRPAAFVLPNLPETHFTIWGGEAAGAALAINPMLEPKQIADLMRSARASVLVTLAPALNAKAWPALAARAGLASRPQSDRVRRHGRLPRRGIPTSCARFHQSGRIGLEPESRQFPGRDARAAFRPSRHGARDPRRRHIVLCLHRRHDRLAEDRGSHAPERGVRRLGRVELDRDGRLAANRSLRLAPVPREWTAGHRASAVDARRPCRARHAGRLPGKERHRALLGDRRALPRLDLLRRADALCAVLETPIGDNDLSSLKFAICGAAPMPLALIRAFEAKTGVKIIEGYGLTEGACVSSVNPPEGERRPGSIGLPIPYQRMAAVILDANGRFERMAGIDEIGVIAINGPNVFSGYLDPRHNTGLWIDIDGERWLNTGDLGRQDANGYFWLAGRKKELIIRGGHNIDPKIIEDALQKHPAVAVVAAIGSPDAYAGELPVAYVQLKPGARRHGGGAHRARRPDHSGEGGGPEARQDFVVSANDRRREAVQAGAHRTRDRGDDSRRGEKARRRAFVRASGTRSA